MLKLWYMLTNIGDTKVESIETREENQGRTDRNNYKRP